MSPPGTVAGPQVTSRPVASARWCAVAALAILALFGSTAVLLRESGDGLRIERSDQIGVIGLGLVLAGFALLPLRPRLEADAVRVRTRGVVGGYKEVPWGLVRAVEFRPKWRWARLVLAAEETISLYAVQRWDGARSVETMRGLRALHAAAHPAAAPDPSAEPAP